MMLKNILIVLCVVILGIIAYFVIQNDTNNNLQVGQYKVTVSDGVKLDSTGEKGTQLPVE